MSSFSGELFAHLDVARDGVASASSELCGSAAFPHLLPEWFAVLWDVIRATTPVLQHAVARLEHRQSTDFDRALLDFYLLKLTEESGHDEMLAADLGRLGVSRAELERRVPSAAIAAMVGSQYYLIDTVHPAAYLGYLAMLEGYPAEVGKLEHAISRSGAPDAWGCYRMHAEVDTWHRTEIEEMVDQVPADDTLRRAIVSNGLRTAEYYCQTLETLVARAGRLAA